jgi:hypothetical protein
MQSNNSKQQDWSDEERDRIVGFFSLLLNVDRRENPELYENNRETKTTEVKEAQGLE